MIKQNTLLKHIAPVSSYVLKTVATIKFTVSDTDGLPSILSGGAAALHPPSRLGAGAGEGAPRPCSPPPPRSLG